MQILRYANTGGALRAKFNSFSASLFVAMAMLVAPLGNSAQAADPYRIIALGDSLTAGYGLTADESFPAVLEVALKQEGYNVSVVNAGVSGDTTTGGLKRLDWTLQDGADLVMVALGANDGLRGVNPQVTQSNLDKIVTTIKGRNMDVLLVGLRAPRSRGVAYQERANAMWPALAHKHQVPLHPDFLKDVFTNPNLKLRDGLHPNERGVQKMVENILPLMRQVLPVEAKQG